MDSMKMFWLRIKAKMRNFNNSKFWQSVIEFDMTFILLFCSLTLFGFQWNLKTFIGSVGLWFLTVEIFRQIRTALSELRKK